MNAIFLALIPAIWMAFESNHNGTRKVAYIPGSVVLEQPLSKVGCLTMIHHITWKNTVDRVEPCPIRD